jgi:uncharacterized membrane protein YccC
MLFFVREYPRWFWRQMIGGVAGATVLIFSLAALHYRWPAVFLVGMFAWFIICLAANSGNGRRSAMDGID